MKPALITLLIVVVASSAAVVAQTITITAVAQSDLVATANNATGAPTSAWVNAGTDVSSGLQLTAQQAGAHSHISVSGNVSSGSSRSFSVATFASTVGGAVGMSAGSGRSEVLVQVTLDQPMTLDVLFFGHIIACAGAITGTAEVDIGNDGTVELQVVPQQNLFGHGELSLKLPMPAGTTDVLLSVDLDLLPSTTGAGRLVEVQSGFSIRPGHAEITWEATPCGGTLSAEPLLDNTSVRFWIAGQQLGDLPFLVLGASRQQATLPVAPGCALLISPDVILPVEPWSYVALPLGMLGAGFELFAQGAILRPVSLPLSPAGLSTTQRLAIEIF